MKPSIRAKIARIIEPPDRTLLLQRRLVVERARRQMLTLAATTIHELVDTGLDLDEAVKYWTDEYRPIHDDTVRMEALATWTGDVTQIRVLKGKGAA